MLLSSVSVQMFYMNCVKVISSFAQPFTVFFQVKAFSRSLESFRTAIVVGGTNIAEQVANLHMYSLAVYFSLFLPFTF